MIRKSGTPVWVFQIFLTFAHIRQEEKKSEWLDHGSPAKVEGSGDKNI